MRGVRAGLVAKRGSMLLVLSVTALGGSLQGQRLNHPSPGTPRTPDGKAALNAPAPRRDVHHPRQRLGRRQLIAGLKCRLIAGFDCPRAKRWP
jgi:hypothetical protein